MTAEMQSPITAHIKQAVAHDRAAGGYEDKYEQQMKAAGSEMYAAFCLAAKAAPERQGRQNTDKALLALYKSTTKRTWWDKELAKVESIKAKDKRNFALRLIQWHIDPEAAQANRGRAVARLAVHNGRVKKQKAAQSRVVQTTREPSAREFAKVVEALSDGLQPDKRPSTMPQTTASILRSDAIATAQTIWGGIVKMLGAAPVGAVNEAVDELKSIRNALAEEIRQSRADSSLADEVKQSGLDRSHAV